MSTIHGACQCGDISFDIDADPLFAGHCSCRDCQRASGAGHSTIVAFPFAAVKVQGETTKYESESERGNKVVREFCPRCGSRLFSREAVNPPAMLVSASAFDDPSIAEPGALVFSGSRQPWDHVNPSLPAFDKMPPGM